MNQTGILLEAGTNELEIMLLQIGGLSFGVNVAKIREVILPTRVHALPEAPPCVEGVFELRGQVVELFDLRQYLDVSRSFPASADDAASSLIIVTEFNKSLSGFRVDGVVGIGRASWDQIHTVPHGLHGPVKPIVGIAQLGDRSVQMLDLEVILTEFKPASAVEFASVEADAIQFDSARSSAKVLVAEDSDAVRAQMLITLHAAGYVQTEEFRTGGEAWSYIESTPVDALPDIVVTDIEMPQLDGLHLCKKLRAHAHLSEVPVVLFSSLINERTEHKGRQVGASAQISKPELTRMVGVLDGLLGIVPSG